MLYIKISVLGSEYIFLFFFMALHRNQSELQIHFKWKKFGLCSDDFLVMVKIFISIKCLRGFHFFKLMDAECISDFAS